MFSFFVNQKSVPTYAKQTDFLTLTKQLNVTFENDTDRYQMYDLDQQATNRLENILLLSVDAWDPILNGRLCFLIFCHREVVTLLSITYSQKTAEHQLRYENEKLSCHKFYSTRHQYLCLSTIQKQ